MKKVVLEYDSLSINKIIVVKVKRTGKIVFGGSIKRRCQHWFVAKKPYLNPSLCIPVYKNTMHLNTRGEHCQGSMVNGFRYALGVGISEDMKHKIAQMHVFRLSPAQIMQEHTKEVKNLALATGNVTCNTFLLPSDVRNICRKRAKELWMKDFSDPISVRMWTLEHPNKMFFYPKHALMDLNYSPQNDAPFTIGIHTKWQLEMMEIFGHNNALSIDATFGTSQTQVWRIPCCRLYYVFVICCIVMSSHLLSLSSNNCMIFLVNHLFVTISTIHDYSFWRLEEWHACGFLCNLLYARARPYTNSSNAPMT